MSRVKSSEFRIKSLIFVFLFIFITLHSAFITPAALAAESSPSADLKSKLQALQTEIASKAAQIKAEISKKLQNKSYVGYIKSKSETSLTVATKSGTKIISINQDTQYSGKTKTTLKSLNNEDYIAALGDVDDTGVLTARKIVKLTPPTADNVLVVWGLVVGISETEVTISTKEGKTQTITLNKKTEVLYGEEEASNLDIKMNKGIVAVGSSPKTNYINARLIYIQPYSSSYNPKAVTPTASPSATATPAKKR